MNISPEDSASNVGSSNDAAVMEQYRKNCKAFINEWWDLGVELESLKNELKTVTEGLNERVKQARKKRREMETKLLPFFTLYGSHVLKDNSTGKSVTCLTENKQILPTTGKVIKLFQSDQRLASSYKPAFDALMAELINIKNVKKLVEKV